MVSKQLASVSGSGRFFTCRGKHLANTCAPKCAQPGAAQACKGPRAEAEPEAEAEAELEVEACVRCATCVSRRCDSVCFYAFWSLPARSSRRPPACVLCVNKSNGQMGKWMCCLLFCLPFAASSGSNCANWPKQMSLSSQEQRANCRLKLPKRRRHGELS